jgi:hypothetical protein
MVSKLRQRVARIGITTAMAVGLFVGFGPGQSSAAAVSCSARTTSNAFRNWGDGNSYFLAPGANFEGGTGGWSGLGTLAVLGNEPWRVNGAGNNWSLMVGALATATSPQFCVGSHEDSVRFFVNRPGIIGSRLHVHIDVQSGVNRATNDYDIDGSAIGWTPVNRIMLPDILDASGKQYVTISLTSAGFPAIWGVDDVMIDPWVAR